MTFYDKTTNFELGSPDIIPLSQKNDLPSFEEVSEAFSSMILSASGWRKIFVQSGQEEDASPEIGSSNTVLSALIAKVFADYIIHRCGHNCTVAVGIDARPTGTLIADTVLRVLAASGITVQYLFITAAPEIMAYAKKIDAFVYISASHNPVGHNGIKFGLNDGGVLPGTETAKLTEAFTALCKDASSIQLAAELIVQCSPETLLKIYEAMPHYKAAAVASYKAFTKEVITGSTDPQKQENFFTIIRENVKEKPLTVVCDMNGSARSLSIDSDFLPEQGISFAAINNKPRHIVHGIIPERDNLLFTAREMDRLKERDASVSLGYMPDCDGDRGNIVFWNDKTKKSEILQAQEVFALSVLAELAYLDYRTEGHSVKAAVAVNDPTSMRINDIANTFNAKVFRAEVGEANVVNLAREVRQQGYTVPILGEGSNGGNITHPAAVRDPINTIFALIKLLVIKDKKLEDTVKLGLFHRWCIKSNQEDKYKEDFTLADIIATLPVYVTTGVSEKRALQHIQSTDHAILKRKFQTYFEKSWEERKDYLRQTYGISSYVAVCNNGTKETVDVKDFGISGKGGLKIIFNDTDGLPCGFIWMRGSGTEPVFRILCDVKGDKPTMEAELLQWETELLLQADK